MFREKKSGFVVVLCVVITTTHTPIILTDTLRNDMKKNIMSTPGIAILQLTVRHSTPAAEVALVALPTTPEANILGNSTGLFHESFVYHLASDAPTHANLSSCAK